MAYSIEQRVGDKSLNQVLDNIPDDWTVCPFSALAQVQEGPGIMAVDFREEGVPLVRISGLKNGQASLDGCNYLDAETVDNRWSHFRIKPDDLLMSGSATMGLVCEATPAVVGAIPYTGIFRIVPKSGVCREYIKVGLQSWLTNAQLEAVRTGSTMQHFGPEHLRKVRWPLPPIQKQKAIALNLDKELSKVDSLIADKERLLQLLDERRQALITEAVTRGLDPTVPMKDSGLPWLGAIPAHWTISRIANIFSEVIESGNDELPILSVSIHRGVSDRETDGDDQERIVNRSEDRSKYKKVCPGDLVYNMMRAWQGGFGAVTVFGMVSPAYVVARPKMPLCTRFIELLLRTPMAVQEIKRSSHGIIDFRLRLYWNEFRNMCIPLPNMDEQLDIISAIEGECNDIGHLTDLTSQSVLLLRAKRSALIHEAVTGQLSIGGLA